MDYYTKPASREDMRDLSVLFRKIFGADRDGIFPVLEALEKLPDIFKGTVVKIVPDDDMPKNIPARCSPDEDGNFAIEIRDNTYKGAYEKNIGAYLGFICHEICHIFLYKAGFTPIFNRQFKNNEIPAYCSVEWQTKALCGEVMMPYEATHNMSEKDIIATYNVSKGFAKKRKTY